MSAGSSTSSSSMKAFLTRSSRFSPNMEPETGTKAGKNAAAMAKSEAVGAKSGATRAKSGAARAGSGGGRAGTAKKTGKRAKAKKNGEKLTPTALYRKMITFGKVYQVEKEQDFIEAARIYAEEAGLIDQMRDKLAEDGLTVTKTYKTGEVEVAHPLLSELPRHVESANRCLATIGNMIGERGAKKERAARDLDKFRLH